MSISLQSLQLIGIDEAISQRWLTELSSPHRHYHDLSHISAIIQEYMEGMQGRDSAILAAAWLHDIRYDARRTDNEAVSAEIAREDLKGTSVDIPLVVDIILDTQHHGGGTTVLDIFSDLDLGIFGSTRRVYDRYMRGIRREYSFFPLGQYAARRADILEGFNEKQIYRTERFAQREKLAHDNLEREIHILRNTPEIVETPLS